MLRLFTQLLWSAEIQLFHGGNVPVRARRWYLDLEPGLGRWDGIWVPKDHEKTNIFAKKTSTNIFVKISYI